MPRPLEEFDFGPAPVLGATASVSAAGSSAFWGSAASGIGKGIAGLAGNINLGGGSNIPLGGIADEGYGGYYTYEGGDKVWNYDP